MPAPCWRRRATGCMSIPLPIWSGSTSASASPGEAIADDHLVAVLERCETANGEAPITYFEVTTAAAFLAFAETPADALLLEVGLGGRLDATNVVPRPAATAITRISMDHMQFLGDTLTAIAAEKAGKSSSPACRWWSDPRHRGATARRCWA